MIEFPKRLFHCGHMQSHELLREVLHKTSGKHVAADLNLSLWMIYKWAEPDEGDGSDYFYCFASYAEALEFSQQTKGAEEPLALILQREYISEPEPGEFIHVKEERITEWPVEFLSRPRRTEKTIPDFMSPDAPANRLDILRGLA
mgnify:CR=1 FL=1